jgi:cytochrome c oxidase subunit 2
MWERFPLTPEQASTFAAEVDLLYYSLVVFSVFFSALVFSLILYFAVRYRRRGGEEHVPEVTSGHLMLEIVWTVVPFAIALGLLVWAVDLFVAQKRPPAAALSIRVVGRQWMWKVQHPTGRSEINELHVPVGRPVVLTMASEDVIHSFFVPAFRVKQDVVPGRLTTMWFEATRVGEYHLFCAEYCGTDHSGMGGRVFVMEPSDYQRWLVGGGVSESPVAAGAQLFERRGCKSCHLAGPSQRGPSLAGLVGSTVTLDSGETLVADENYIRESVLSPNAKIVAGFRPLMPTFRGQIGEEGMMALIAYINTLRPEKPSTD